jgi:hypothetical protein
MVTAMYLHNGNGRHKKTYIPPHLRPVLARPEPNKSLWKLVQSPMCFAVSPCEIQSSVQQPDKIFELIRSVSHIAPLALLLRAITLLFLIWLPTVATCCVPFYIKYKRLNAIYSASIPPLPSKTWKTKRNPASQRSQ